MAGWTRMQRASIVLVGMTLAIPLFWLGRPGWAVGIGFVSLSLFWLSIPAETPPESTELDDQPKD